MRKMNTRKLAAPLVASLALTLGACGTMNMENRSLYSVKQPVVERSNYVFDVRTDGGGIPVSEQQRLAGWFESMDLRHGDRVAIDDPTVSVAVTEDVADLAARHGVLLTDGVPVTTGSVGPGQARVVLTRSTASVPNCPDWSHTAEWNPANSTNPNYGCATNSNLAAMVANPEDLITGQKGTGETVVTTSTKAIQSYRDQAPSGAGGGVSQVSSQGGN